MNTKRLPCPEEQIATASVTVCTYMKQAAESINEQFGGDYAASHPELVAAFIQAAASERLSAVLYDHMIPAMDSMLERG